jgi:hypothetical protein
LDDACEAGVRTNGGTSRRVAETFLPGWARSARGGPSWSGGCDLALCRRYASALGLVPHEFTDFGDAWYVIDGTRMQLYASQYAGTNQATAATIEVDDVQATVDEFKARGVVTR